jgi:prephenate dehydrogenase
LSPAGTDFERISIIGLGLIGGSWGLALREHGFNARRTGYDRPEILRLAVERGVVDVAAPNFASAVLNADLIILATPVAAILELLSQLKGNVKRSALITDTGSTKRLICRHAAEVFDGNALFLGGHPLAGKERSGLEHADAGLFRNTRYVLTPHSPDDLEDVRVKAFVELVKSFGATLFVTDPSSHDRAAAFLSHLPQLLSTGLASLIAEQAAEDFLPAELAAAGFRDVTRLAESPYNVWRDICLTNIENIQSALEALIEKLEDMKGHLSDRELEREFRQALKLREKLREIR